MLRGEPRAMLLPLVLLACNPWAGVHQREAIWYDAARVETELGIALAPLKASAPLGHHPRILVRSDGIGFDNRAWFLSLPDTYFLREDASVEELSAPLIEEELLVALEDGRLSASEEGGLGPGGGVVGGCCFNRAHACRRPCPCQDGCVRR